MTYWTDLCWRQQEKIKNKHRICNSIQLAVRSCGLSIDAVWCGCEMKNYPCLILQILSPLVVRRGISCCQAESGDGTSAHYAFETMSVIKTVLFFSANDHEINQGYQASVINQKILSNKIPACGLIKAWQVRIISLSHHVTPWGLWMLTLSWGMNEAEEWCL